MPDLQTLLEGSGHGPARAPDPDELWRAGRRRRRAGHAAAAGGVTAALVATIALGVTFVHRPTGVDIGPAGPVADSPSATAPSPSSSGTRDEASAPEGRTKILSHAGRYVDGPAYGATVAQLRFEDGDVELHRIHPDGGGEIFRVHTEAPGTTLHGFAVAGDGTIGFQTLNGAKTRVFRLERDSDDAVELTSSTHELRVEVVGSADLDGRSALLVAEGRAESLLEDDGTDVVAYFADGQRRTVVPYAGSAWEGGVAAADARDGWITWSASDTTTNTVWAAPLDDPDDRIELLHVDPEAGDPGVVDLVVVERDDAGPVVGILLYHRAGFPEEPTAELLTIELPDGEMRRYPVGPVGWDAGLPAALSRVDDGWLVSRMGEGYAPRQALGGVPPTWRPFELDGLVRIAR